MASNNHLVRSQNKQLVLKQLFQHESLFAADIVKATGISMVTVNSLIRELLAEDTIIKGPLQQKKYGAAGGHLSTKCLKTTTTSPLSDRH